MDPTDKKQMMFNMDFHGWQYIRAGLTASGLLVNYGKYCHIPGGE
jgi:hypothetical protein